MELMDNPIIHKFKDKKGRDWKYNNKNSMMYTIYA